MCRMKTTRPLPLPTRLPRVTSSPVAGVSSLRSGAIDESIAPSPVSPNRAQAASGSATRALVASSFNTPPRSTAGREGRALTGVAACAPARNGATDPGTANAWACARICGGGKNQDCGTPSRHSQTHDTRTGNGTHTAAAASPRMITRIPPLVLAALDVRFGARGDHKEVSCFVCRKFAITKKAGGDPSYHLLAVRRRRRAGRGQCIDLRPGG